MTITIHLSFWTVTLAVLGLVYMVGAVWAFGQMRGYAFLNRLKLSIIWPLWFIGLSLWSM